MKKISGVYIITNIINNKHYIGESYDIHRRLLSHKNDLINNRHKNNFLQNSFNKYGLHSFTFEDLDLCSNDLCHAMEHYWCTLLRTHESGFGYNIRLTCTDTKAGKHSAASKLKLSIAHKGKKISDSHRLNMSLAQKRRDNTGGQYRSKEAKKIISDENKSRSKAVCQFARSGEFIKEWSNRLLASQSLKIGYSAICNSTLGYRPTAGGFIWSFKKAS